MEHIHVCDSIKEKKTYEKFKILQDSCYMFIGNDIYFRLLLRQWYGTTAVRTGTANDIYKQFRDARKLC